MKYAYPGICILALACALWIAHAAEKIEQYHQRVAVIK